MAKKKQESAPESETAPAATTILLEDGQLVAVSDDTDPRAPIVETPGGTYVHVADAPDGRWIYAHNYAHRR